MDPATEESINVTGNLLSYLARSGITPSMVSPDFSG